MTTNLSFKLFVCLATVAAFFPNSNSYQILGFFPTPVYSHQVPFFNLFDQLVARGHNVTLLAGFPLPQSNVSQYKYIHVSSVLSRYVSFIRRRGAPQPGSGSKVWFHGSDVLAPVPLQCICNGTRSNRGEKLLSTQSARYHGIRIHLSRVGHKTPPSNPLDQHISYITGIRPCQVWNFISCHSKYPVCW
uniref:Uncharacterized protein n=1 Tax=Cacopsylla melanoneura TaxID=428564 RepID=A0A8D9ER81_9HEMI